ncbi:hypothetical protein OG2516_00359 [Oceanicola granulosus HTCC2516]|uniref:Sulfotransferase family protein n=1 Tax=Oceanicola granulosus (strain ATCC BAA-861 / DSM 15982 / KCTC 12143 / HTCC2516) TaxID=314256 RepID=Q2CJG8_OCEGH|nr:hypothetical protein [Oceanicola granulosus]EAR52632.1 hypothetical protein OG2516_00359 [Oceanicola granulosus HTCC2516]
MDVILHIGAHRTGTTTFQNFLDLNRSHLHAAGLEAWTPRRTSNGLLDTLVGRPGEGIGGRMGRAVARRAQGRLEVEVARVEKAGRRQLLISEENMIGAVRNNLREVALYPALEARLARISPIFAERVCRIGLSIRSYDGYWSSALAFAVARGHRVPEVDVLDRLVTQPRRWRDVVREVARVFPEADLLVWPFESAVGRPDWQTERLTRSLTCSPRLPGARDWRHRSLFARDLAQIARARGEGLPEGGGGEEGRWMPFDADQRRTLQALYESDLTWLRAGADGLARLEDGTTVPANRDDRCASDRPMTGGGDGDRRRHATG